MEKIQIVTNNNFGGVDDDDDDAGARCARLRTACFLKKKRSLNGLFMDWKFLACHLCYIYLVPLANFHPLPWTGQGGVSALTACHIFNSCSSFTTEYTSEGL